MPVLPWQVIHVLAPVSCVLFLPAAWFLAREGLASHPGLWFLGFALLLLVSCGLIYTPIRSWAIQALDDDRLSPASLSAVEALERGDVSQLGDGHVEAAARHLHETISRSRLSPSETMLGHRVASIGLRARVRQVDSRRERKALLRAVMKKSLDECRPEHGILAICDSLLRANRAFREPGLKNLLAGAAGAGDTGDV